MFAEDTCRHGGEGVPHAQTGDAAILNYQCVNGRMTRDPYLERLRCTEGYQSAPVEETSSLKEMGVCYGARCICCPCRV